MKLNIDCVRDSLLFIENEHRFTADNGSERLPIDSLFTNVILSSTYSQNDISYSVNQLWRSGLIEFKEFKAMRGGFDGWILDITPAGHEFLENVRKDTNWTKTKDISKSVGSQSLSAIKDIATNVISSVISSQFQ